MNDKNITLIQYAILFAACYSAYKTINIVDACVRTYLVRKYHVYVEDYPTVSLERFFADDDWD